MAIASYADKYKEYLANKDNPKKNAGTARNYSVNSSSDPTADIVLGTLFMNPVKVARGISAASGKEMSEDAKKAVGWASKAMGVDIGRGFFGAAEGITDFLAGGAAQLVGQKDAAKWIYNHSWSQDATGTDVTDEFVGDAAETKGYRLASDLLSGFGNVGFQIAVGTLIGGALAAPVADGTISAAGARAIQYAPLFFSASGSGTAENMQKTGNLGWRENVGGLLKGGVEVLTEIASPTGRLADAALFGKSAKGMSRYLVKNAVAKNILSNFAQEAGEEAASYVGDYFIEKWLNISDEKFSWGDLGYQAVLGGITGALFSTPSDVLFIRQARKAGAEVYAKGETAVKSKIDEGLIEVAALKERGLNNDAVQLADAALGRLMTDEKLDQRTKEYYLGLAEQMVMRAELTEQYNALAKDLNEKAKADPTFAQTLADEFNAIVNSAGGEGKYTAADFTNENSEAARIYVVAQMANDWLSRSDADTAIEDIMTRKAASYQGTEEQKTAIRSMEDGSTVAFRVGNNAYAVVTKRAGTDTYSVGYTTPGQVESDGTVVATHNLTAEKVEEMLAKPMTEQQIDAGIVENLAKKAQAEVEKEQKAEKKQAKTETKKKPAAKTEAKTEEKQKKKAETRTEAAQTEQTGARTNAAAKKLYQRYVEARKKYPDTIVAVRRGDNYVILGDGAEDVAKALKLKIRKMTVDGNTVQTVLVPYETAQENFATISSNINDLTIVDPKGNISTTAAYNRDADTSLSPAATETEQTAQTEQTAEQAQTETKKVTPEDLSTVEKRLTSAFGIDGSEFTKEEWTKARECVPNINGLTRREQARVLTLVRTAQANGVNEDYMKGLARLSSVYGFGVVFEDIDVSGFYSRKNGMVVINPKNLDETYGHEIEHSFDQIVKEGKTEFRTDLSERVKRIVGASVFDKAKAQYKTDYDKLRARDGAIPELSDAELEAEATANVVGKYLSNMTLLKKLAATDYKLGRGLLAAIRRMKDKWAGAKAFAKENDSTAFAEYRKMTRIEKLLVEELNKAKNAKQTGTEAPSGENISYSPAGDTLSAAFKRWFKNSPFKNEDGTPKVYYHGAKKGGGFTVFRDWQYFTDKKQYAERYAKYNPNALYEVYLTADKVFDTRNADARKIFQSIRDEYGLSELQDTGLPDWTDGYDITEYLSEHPELNYDAVILDEGGDLVDGEPVSRGESIIIKDSAQVKSATDNIGTYDRANPDIRYSPASYGGKSGRYVAQSQPARQTIREKITNKAGQLNRQGFRNALKEGGSVVEGFKIGFVNAQQAVENQLVRAGMTKREAAAVIQYARTGRSHAFNAAQYKLADMTGEIRSDGLLKIIEPFLATKGEVFDAVDPKTGETVPTVAKGGEMGGRKYIDFGDYYSMLHALDREAAGNNPYLDMTVADMKRIVAEYEKENPDFKAAAEKLSEFNSALLDIEVQAGIRSQENADNLRKKYPHYIPMYVQEDGEIGRAPVRGARNMEVRRDNKAATESNHRVNDAIKNYLNQVERRIRAAKFNLVLQEVYNSADDVNVVKAEDAKATARDLREREKAYLENPETETDPAEMFRKVQKGRQTVNEVSFYMDGKRVTMAVTDRIYTGLSDLAGIHSSILDLGLVKFVAKINSTFKKLVTNWNPFFAVKNIARDLQDGMLQSKFGMGEFIAMYKKNAEMMMSGKYNKEWELFLANGCLEASIFSDEFGTVAKSGKSGLEQAVGVAGQFQHIKNFNTLTEALPRFTEFCLTLKHGGTIQQAIYNAADVTVNFGRSGTLIRILNSTVSPFLNPAVQGLDRVIRLFTEDGIKNNKALASLLLKAVLLAIVPMALGNAMYGNDDEYKDMQDNIKENNYLFKVGNTWLKIPRGRFVSTISGMFNRSYKELMGEDVDWKGYAKNVLDQITPAQNVARHIGSPFYDVANNRTWYGTKIESDALQNYAVNQRYDENTSRISVWIGQLTSHFGLSPKEVNYLIDQYTGVVGDILLPTTTPAGTKGVVSYNFTVDPNTSSNLSNRFYDLYNKTMYKSNDGDVEAYYLKKRLDETKSAVSELFKEIKTINADSSLSNKEKVKQASAIRAMINQLYKTALDDRRLYEQNIKDALAIENSYAVEKITAQSAKRNGLDSDAVGKYALTFGGDFAKQFSNEAQANDYKADASKKTVYAEANRLTYGAEYALREYNVNVYDKAKTLNELGISYDEYYNYYMTVRYYSGKTKKQKILAYLNASDLSKSQIALMMYYSGYTAYADEAKKAIKASSLSAERKKELLAGLTN